MNGLWFTYFFINIGFHIIHCGLFSYWFEKGEPKEKEYFTYESLSQESKYNIALRYPFLEKTYGVSPKKSKINANKKKARQIVEIDLDRVDIRNDVAYKELIYDRNKLYFRYFTRNLIAISIPLIILALLLVVL